MHSMSTVYVQVQVGRRDLVYLNSLILQQRCLFTDTETTIKPRDILREFRPGGLLSAYQSDGVR